jgi:hypothetical protein
MSTTTVTTSHPGAPCSYAAPLSTSHRRFVRTGSEVIDEQPQQYERQHYNNPYQGFAPRLLWLFLFFLPLINHGDTITQQIISTDLIVGDEDT